MSKSKQVFVGYLHWHSAGVSVPCAAFESLGAAQAWQDESSDPRFFVALDLLSEPEASDE